jgi:hypothetical protein
LLALADMEGLPPSHHGVDRHAPCPCCSPKSPKFYKNGKIAWFPDEHVIRMIGPDCFQTLNPEGHWEAVEVFNREEAERRTIAYLVANLHLNVPTRDVIQRALPILEAVDHVHTVLQQRISEVLRLDIWRHVGRGTLSVNVEGRRMKRNRDGSQEVESFLDIQQLSEFPGYQMFSPRNSRLASRVGGFARRLSLIDFGNEVEERVRAMTTEEQAKAAYPFKRDIFGCGDIRGSRWYSRWLQAYEHCRAQRMDPARRLPHSPLRFRRREQFRHRHRRTTRIAHRNSARVLARLWRSSSYFDRRRMG